MFIRKGPADNSDGDARAPVTIRTRIIIRPTAFLRSSQSEPVIYILSVRNGDRKKKAGGANLEFYAYEESIVWRVVVKKPSWINPASPGFAGVSWSGLHKNFRQSHCPKASEPARAKPLWAVYSSRSSKCRAFSQHRIRPKALSQKKLSPNFGGTILKTCWSRLYDFGRS